jgi:hypothetical protein
MGAHNGEEARDLGLGGVFWRSSQRLKQGIISSDAGIDLQAVKLSRQHLARTGSIGTLNCEYRIERDSNEGFFVSKGRRLAEGMTGRTGDHEGYNRKLAAVDSPDQELTGAACRRDKRPALGEDEGNDGSHCRPPSIALTWPIWPATVRWNLQASDFAERNRRDCCKRERHR